MITAGYAMWRARSALSNAEAPTPPPATVGRSCIFNMPPTCPHCGELALSQPSLTTRAPRTTWHLKHRGTGSTPLPRHDGTPTSAQEQ